MEMYKYIYIYIIKASLYNVYTGNCFGVYILDHPYTMYTGNYFGVCFN